MSSCGMLASRSVLLPLYVPLVSLDGLIEIHQDALEVGFEHREDLVCPGLGNLHSRSGGGESARDGGDGVGVGRERHGVADGLFIRARL